MVDILEQLPPSCLRAAGRGWAGLQATFERDSSGRPVFTGAVQGMGAQTDAAGYLRIPRLKHSTHLTARPRCSGPRRRCCDRSMVTLSMSGRPFAETWIW